MDALEPCVVTRAGKYSAKALEAFAKHCETVLKYYHELNNLNNKSGVNPPSNADGSL